MPVVDETLLWIWQAFRDLSSTRGMGQGITYTEILAYCQIYDFDEESTLDLIKWIEWLDVKFFALSKKMKPSSPTPPPLSNPTPPPKIVTFPKRR